MIQPRTHVTAVPLPPHPATLDPRKTAQPKPISYVQATRAPHPATLPKARAVQRMVDVQPPIRELDLPRIVPDTLVDDKRARELAQAYWEYLMNFYDIWGCWPWEWGRVRRKKEYVYERDPKQAARDYIEYVRARRQIRMEAEIESEIERTTQYREEAQTRFEMIRYLHTIAPEMRRRMEQAALKGTERQVIEELVKDCAERFPNIEVVPPHIIEQLKDPAYFETYLKSGFEQVMNRWDQMRSDEDRAEFVTELLAHDKGYPRLVNMVNNFIPFEKRTIENVITSWLFGFSNVNMFTGKSEDSSASEQIEARVKIGLSSGDRYNLWIRVFGELARRFRLTTRDAFLRFMERNMVALQNQLTGLLPGNEIKMAGDYVDPIAESIFPDVVEEEEVAPDNYELPWNTFQMEFRVDSSKAARGQFEVGDVLVHPKTKARYRITQVGDFKSSTKYKLTRVG